MPQHHGMLERANQTFARDNLPNLKAEHWTDDKDLLHGMTKNGIISNDLEKEMMKHMPRAMQAAVRAVIHANITRSQDPHNPDDPYVIQWAWGPSLHYELHIIAEMGPIQGSGGGITVLMRTPTLREMKKEG